MVNIVRSVKVIKPDDGIINHKQFIVYKNGYPNVVCEVNYCGNDRDRTLTIYDCNNNDVSSITIYCNHRFNDIFNGENYTFYDCKIVRKIVNIDVEVYNDEQNNCGGEES